MTKHKKLKIGLIIVGVALIIGGVAALIVSHTAGLTTEKYEGISQDPGVFGKEIVIHDALDGEKVILNKLSSADKMENNALPKGKTTNDPDTILDDSVQAGTFTTADKAKMQDGSIGVLTIPKLKLSSNVFASETTDTIDAMNHGIAHFPNTSAWDGNVAMSAHNINFNGNAGFFLNLHTLKEGDEVMYTTALGERTYQVTSTQTIKEADWSPLSYTEDNRLTLITCITGQSSNRLCVQAVEVSSK